MPPAAVCPRRGQGTDIRTCWQLGRAAEPEGSSAAPGDGQVPPSPFQGPVTRCLLSSEDRRDDAKDTSGCRRRGDGEGRTARPRETHKSQLLRNALLSPPTEALWSLSSSPSLSPPLPSLQAQLHQVGLDLGLVHGVQEVLGVHGQGVGGRQHLPLALLAQRGDGVLLRQAHLVDEVSQVLVEQLLGSLDLTMAHRGYRHGWHQHPTPHQTPLPAPQPYLGAGGSGQDGQDLVNAADQLPQGQAHVLWGG